MTEVEGAKVVGGVEGAEVVSGVEDSDTKAGIVVEDAEVAEVVDTVIAGAEAGRIKLSTFDSESLIPVVLVTGYFPNISCFFL